VNGLIPLSVHFNFRAGYWNGSFAAEVCCCLCEIVLSVEAMLSLGVFLTVGRQCLRLYFVTLVVCVSRPQTCIDPCKPRGERGCRTSLL
jgi:hypothetical protein